MNPKALIILSLILIFSCKTKKEKNTVDKNTILEDSIQKYVENEPETFDNFYKRFYSDSTFQFSRIKFP
jgi:hypothetical protein